MELVFRPMEGLDRPSVSSMIKGLYAADLSDKEMTDEKIQRTFDELMDNPLRGTIMVMEKDSLLVGYAILINFWSNEYGGNVIFLDELFVIPSERGLGIGSEFIRRLKENRPNDCKAILLEVLPSNLKTIAFYERIGFHRSRYSHLVMDFTMEG